jgi:hypothetical protein
MTADERERFYDEDIAPMLAEIGWRCAQHGLSFLAAVEWRPGAIGRTVQLCEQRGYGIDHANAAIIANGETDVLIAKLIAEAQRFGHESEYLRKLGVPYRPAGD